MKAPCPVPLRIAVIVLLSIAVTDTRGVSQVNPELIPHPLPAHIPEAELDSAAAAAGFTRASYPFFSAPNGCGPGDSWWRYHLTPDGPPGCDFTPACIEHDRCYMTSQNKEVCDHALRENALELCRAIPELEKILCTPWAEAFYAMVTELGSRAFHDAQASQRSYVRFVSEYLEPNR